jgi:agmatinase
MTRVLIAAAAALAAVASGGCGKAPPGSATDRPASAAHLTATTPAAGDDVDTIELRAHAAAHGPVGVVLLDAHADTWDRYYGERYFHGTPFRRAVEEGLVDPRRSLFAGVPGPLHSAADLAEPREWGFEILSTDELRALHPYDFARLVRDRLGDAPAYLSFDIDVLDPAFAPGTGTPEVAGLLPHEALAFVRSRAPGSRSSSLRSPPLTR